MRLSSRTLLPLCLLLVLALPSVAQRDDRLRIGQQDVYMSGANVAWINFGRDIGPGTTRFDQFEEMFREMRDAGGNSARLWVHINGTNTPEWSGSEVVGPGAGAIADLQALLDLAQEHNITLLLCLWSFDMIRNSLPADVLNRNRALFSNMTRLQGYIDHALVPMVTALRGHPALLGWEIFNEAEGMSGEFGWPTIVSPQHMVSMAEIQRFVNRTAGAIRRADPTTRVTTGAWSFRAMSDVTLPGKTDAEPTPAELADAQATLTARYQHPFTPEETRAFMQAATASQANQNYYRDDRLIARGGDPDGILDFYTVHYYTWGGTALSPFHHAKRVWGLDKPLVVAEFYMNTTFGVPWQNLYKTLFDLGYAGAMGWQWVDTKQNREGGSNNHAWPNMLANMRMMFEQQRAEVELRLSPLRVTFRADPERIEAGDSTRLSWTVRGASSISLDGLPVSADGARWVSPTDTTTYTLAATADGVEDSRAVTVFVVPPDQINRAQGRRTWASASETGFGNENPNFATDGDLNTRWSSPWQDAHWLAVDLGRVIEVSSLVLRWEAAFGREYDLQVSYDGQRWRTVHEERAGDGGIDAVALPQPAPARFIRMVGLRRGTTWGYSLWEFEAYGVPARVQPPVVAWERPSAGLTLPAGVSTTLSLTATGTLSRVVFLANGDSLGQATEAPYAFTWMPEATGTYRLTALAYDERGVPGLADERVVYVGRAVDRIRYEAEAATLSGDVFPGQQAAASGGAYVNMENTGVIAFQNVSVARTGAFRLAFGYRLPFEPKSQVIRVNGQSLGEVRFAGATNQWLVHEMDVDLVAGLNTIAIEKSWGYMWFDYIDVIGEGQAVRVSNEALADDLLETRLHAPFPNPFRTTATLAFTLAEPTSVVLDVYDLTGRRVARLAEGAHAQGRHEVTLEAGSLPAGLYLLRLHAGQGVHTGRLTLIR